MNIIIFNITLNWVYRLYNDYLINIINYINKKYKNIKIINEFYDKNNYSKNDFINQQIKYLYDYDKIILTGDISIIAEIIDLFDEKYKEKIYFLNFEQMSNESYYKYIRILPEYINIIDYSEENLPYFKSIYNNVYLLPPIYNFISKDINIKDIDLLSLKNNSYREDILNNIKLYNNYNIQFINNIYDKERDNLYKRTKIYLNIHASSNHNTMELIRIINLLCNKVIIISQKSICHDLLFIKEYIIICNDNNLLNNYINNVLENYSYYYNKFFIKENCFNFENYKEYFEKNFNLILNS